MLRKCPNMLREYANMLDMLRPRPHMLQGGYNAPKC